jgi:hypothetical protein
VSQDTLLWLPYEVMCLNDGLCTPQQLSASSTPFFSVATWVLSKTQNRFCIVLLRNREGTQLLQTAFRPAHSSIFAPVECISVPACALPPNHKHSRARTHTNADFQASLRLTVSNTPQMSSLLHRYSTRLVPLSPHDNITDQRLLAAYTTAC